MGIGSTLNGAMKLRDIYARPGPAFSFEFFPPKSAKGDENLFQEVAALKALRPSFCSVTYGAGGSTRERTVDLLGRIHRECGLEVMGHLTVVDQSKEEVRSVLVRLMEHGIRNIIALGGDPPQGTPEWRPHPDGFQHAVELVREAAAREWFSIAVAGFPEVHPRAESRESDLRHLKAKVDAGADVVITQLFFDNDDYYRYVEDVRRLGVRVPIVAGILPILSVAQVRRFTALCAAKIPPRLERLLPQVEDSDEAAVELGIDYATRQCEGLIRFGAPGIHFYCLNKSRSVKAIFRNLGL
jgi:methylenetetrahydrofolate reductase (NADPH)